MESGAGTPWPRSTRMAGPSRGAIAAQGLGAGGAADDRPVFVGLPDVYRLEALRPCARAARPRVSRLCSGRPSPARWRC